MASSKRLIGSVSALSNLPSTPYICAACRSTIPSRSSHQVRHNSDVPFTERLRRKIWGTDNPPGLKDPYGGPSFLERRWAQKKQAQQQQGQEPEQEQQSSPEPQSQIDLIPDEPRRRIVPRPGPTVLDRSDAKQYKPEAGVPAEYQEATTWEGLEWKGHKGEYKYMEPTAADDYVPWMVPEPRAKHSEEALWDALHESVFDAVQPAEEAYDREAIVHVNSEGYVALAAEGATGGADAFKMARLDFNNLAAPTFKILKNFQLLTRLRLSDPMLNKLSQNPNVTFHDLVTEVLEAQKSKPKGTHDILIANSELRAQSNVKIVRRKVQPDDKERELGRLKVIQAELMRRGLPLFGRAEYEGKKKDHTMDKDGGNEKGKNVYRVL